MCSRRSAIGSAATIGWSWHPPLSSPGWVPSGLLRLRDADVEGQDCKYPWFYGYFAR